jgi:glycosyltransferase involved in cell wall biosynthesis
MDEARGLMVSVVTAFYNEERFLRECIESVISQTYENWELILVDDGSTDNSPFIAKEYAAKFPGKVVYVQHEDHVNLGVCKSRNLGIKTAKGDYIALLDADDFWMQEKLDMQMKLTLEYPRAGMYCEATYYMNKGVDPRHENVNVPVGTIQDKLYAPGELIFKLYPIGKGIAPCMNSILIQTKLVKEIGGFEESFVGKYSLYEDQAFLFKCYFHTYVYVSSLSNNAYRQRPDSSMHTSLSSGNYKQGWAFFLKWVREYVRSPKAALTPLISVVTPFKNEERFLEECINSVINQTYHNWEFLLIDDGSTDKSTEIAKSYAQKFPGKIFYFDHEHHVNRGVCVSRNLGIEKAAGDFVAFLDGDDMWMPEKLKVQVSMVLENLEAEMFCEATYYLDEGRNPKLSNTNVPVGVVSDMLYPQPSLVFRLYPLGPGNAPCMNGILASTNLLRTIGGFEESFVGSNSLYEDQAFLFKIYYHSAVFVSSVCNNVYRQRPDSSMHSSLAGGNYKKGRRYFLEWLKIYLKKQDVQYPAVWALYKKCWLSLVYPRVYKYTYGMYYKFRKPVS